MSSDLNEEFQELVKTYRARHHMPHSKRITQKLAETIFNTGEAVSANPISRGSSDHDDTLQLFPTTEILFVSYNPQFAASLRLACNQVSAEDVSRVMEKKRKRTVNNTGGSLKRLRPSTGRSHSKASQIETSDTASDSD